MMYSFRIYALCSLWMLFVACGEKGEKKNQLAVTIEPQRFFVEKIAGEKFAVHCVVPAGQSPETYDPAPREMMRIAESRAYLRIGPIGFERAWMENIRANNPHVAVFDLSEGMTLLHDACTSGAGEEESHHHDHHHAEGDPHIWSSIEGAKIIARNSLQALLNLDQANAPYYRANYDKLTATIEQTERQLHRLLDSIASRTFIIYHPSLTYFAQEFGLQQLVIETDGKEPSPAQLKRLVETARTNGTRIVFIQQEFDRKNAELIAQETGCRLVTINPLNYRWDEEMIRIAKALADEETD